MKLDIENYQMNVREEKANGPFLFRDVSWIDFNRRVLFCAKRKAIPMNERMKFLAITESNLDEFIGVRFGFAFNNPQDRPYKRLLDGIKSFMEEQNETFKDLKKLLKKKYDIKFVKPKNLNKKELNLLSKTFNNDIFPLLTPLDVTNNHSNVDSCMSYVGAIVKRGNSDSLIIVPLISSLDPLIQINNKVILLEDVILHYIKELFVNQNIVCTGVFRIVKDASALINHDDAEDDTFIIDKMMDTLDRRTNSNALFLEMRKGSDERLEKKIMSVFKIPSDHCFNKKKVVNYGIFMKECILNKEEHSYHGFEPFKFENDENYYNIFDALDHEDILLHHPYDSYETVVKFIQHSATDPDVKTIKQTLYRVSGINSPIIEALCEASRNGKVVTVLVELKARFDELNNINIINKLKKAGINVLVGDEYLKTHCKMCIVTRKVGKELKIYSHVATGNYNEKTAKIYSDLSYLTSKHKIGIDLLNIFNIISGYSKPDEKLDKVYYSPVNLRKTLEKCIDREISHVKRGRKGKIFIKVNSISDVRMVNKLYEAADAGVKIEIICRGICSLKSRKNLKIKSIVGRFLEHSRIYSFMNHKTPEIYISSADLLTRNLDRRVETLILLKDTNVTDDINWITSVLTNDEFNSFKLKKSGKWKNPKGNGFDAHQWMTEYSNIKKTKKSWKDTYF